MSSTRKIALSILGGLVLLVCGALIAGRIWWKRNGERLMREGKQEVAAGRQVGRGAPASRCVAQVLGRHAQAPVSLSATLTQSLFLNGCLETADSVAGYCASNADWSVTGQARWALALCREHGATDQYCSSTLQPLMATCRRLGQRPGT